MIRDYMDHELQRVLRQIEDLGRQEQIVRDSKRPEDRRRRDEAEGKVKRTRENLLTDLPPAATFEFLGTTGIANAVDFRTVWQEKNYEVDCLLELDKLWKDSSGYYKSIFELPKINLAILPAYSFLIQFTFTLAQPYISRDEGNFYIIDNPIRKDKVFGLPYVASTSWKGSLRAAIWHWKDESKHKPIYRLFGNEKGEENQEKLHAGHLFFFPTFFTHKSLEIINPQNREKRTGENPIPFESVPIGIKARNGVFKPTTGIFTLLYVPFDRIGEDAKETRKQVAEELKVLTKGLQAMFRTYGFGAKTSSGFGLAREDVGEGTLTIRVDYSPTPFKNFAQLVKVGEELAAQLESALKEGQNDRHSGQ